jgi:hypothetical protein
MWPFDDLPDESALVALVKNGFRTGRLTAIIPTKVSRMDHCNIISAEDK